MLSVECIRNFRLEKLEHSFQHQNRDFVFLVNQSIEEDLSIKKHISSVKKSLTAVLDDDSGAVESSDRISLVTFAKDSKRIFSLVEKDKNFTQLRN